jgi:uncharacterized circularly permuted ATP-grasp superfamily protein
MDKTTLTLHPTQRACWMKIGQQKRIPATQPAEKKKRHVFGDYNWQKDTMTWTVAKTKNSATFIDFLEELLVKKNYPTGGVIMAMGNASYHKSASACANKLQDNIEAVVKNAETIMTNQNLLPLSVSHFQVSKNL